MENWTPGSMECLHLKFCPAYRNSKSSSCCLSLSQQKPALTWSVCKDGIAFKVFFHLILPQFYLTLQFFQSITDKVQWCRFWSVSQVPAFVIPFPEQNNTSCVNQMWSCTTRHSFRTPQIAKYSSCVHFHSDKCHRNLERETMLPNMSHNCQCWCTFAGEWL